ncbi:hypothetical protein SAMN04489835_4233 [Mycolicibacterium rutilum]|uniref:Uncharacterized protein n=1 Tax=Mycolicibacterium rutilum TaxID=370526 RepID=A0A1H6L2L9_MYCRU|nr:hypothetical protein [Mycolicibacterium rutilum]SEH79596.1 hypothetical protein SAMN04489835_4233 [Mycolicibacterium rutilum]
MDARSFDGSALVDWKRSVCLCDVGLAGYLLAVAVDTDGRDVLLVVNDELFDTDRSRYRLDVPEHEKTGPLPRRYAKGVWGGKPEPVDPNQAIVIMRENGKAYADIAHRLNYSYLEWRRPGGKLWSRQLVRARYLRAKKSGAR